MSLTAEDISIVQRQWEVPKKDLAGSGAIVLGAYLAKYPEHQKVFDKFRSIPLEELKTTDKFKNHATKIMQALDKSIGALGQGNMAAVEEEVWGGLGDIHFRKKIPRPYFNDLKGVIFEILGPLCNMNDRDVEAWNKVFEIVYGIMFKKMDELEGK